MGEQQDNIRRVSKKIRAHIIEFWRTRLGDDTDFHMEDLVSFVRAQIPNVAPDSASRILRDLKHKGVLNYVVLSRSKSLYRLLPLEPVPEPEPDSISEPPESFDTLMASLMGAD